MALPHRLFRLYTRWNLLNRNCVVIECQSSQICWCQIDYQLRHDHTLPSCLRQRTPLCTERLPPRSHAASEGCPRKCYTINLVRLAALSPLPPLSPRLPPTRYLPLFVSQAILPAQPWRRSGRRIAEAPAKVCARIRWCALHASMAPL